MVERPLQVGQSKSLISLGHIKDSYGMAAMDAALEYKIRVAVTGESP